MNLKNLIMAINNTGWTHRELNEIAQAVTYARASLGHQIKRSIKVGDTVEFTSSKTGRLTQGRVRKIAIKFVTVDTGLTVWRVPANMLTVVDKELA